MMIIRRNALETDPEPGPAGLPPDPDEDPTSEPEPEPGPAGTPDRGGPDVDPLTHPPTEPGPGGRPRDPDEDAAPPDAAPAPGEMPPRPVGAHVPPTLVPADDPTMMRNQPALRTSYGGVWLVVGAVLAAVCCAVLALQVLRNDPVLAIGSAAAVLVLYAAMVVERVTVRLPARLVVMALTFAAIPVWTVGWLLAFVTEASLVQ